MVMMILKREALQMSSPSLQYGLMASMIVWDKELRVRSISLKQTKQQGWEEFHKVTSLGCCFSVMMNPPIRMSTFTDSESKNSLHYSIPYQIPLHLPRKPQYM